QGWRRAAPVPPRYCAEQCDSSGRGPRAACGRLIRAEPWEWIRAFEGKKVVIRYCAANAIDERGGLLKDRPRLRRLPRGGINNECPRGRGAIAYGSSRVLSTLVTGRRKTALDGEARAASPARATVRD